MNNEEESKDKNMEAPARELPLKVISTTASIPTNVRPTEKDHLKVLKSQMSASTSNNSEEHREA